MKIAVKVLLLSTLTQNQEAYGMEKVLLLSTLTQNQEAYGMEKVGKWRESASFTPLTKSLTPTL